MCRSCRSTRRASSVPYCCSSAPSSCGGRDGPAPARHRAPSTGTQPLFFITGSPGDALVRRTPGALESPRRPRLASHERKCALAKIPQALHEHINTAFPTNVCLVGTVLPNGFAQVSPRGSTMVFDDEHIALWERGKGWTSENLRDGTKVTVFLRKPALREAGILPKGGILRLYGRA